jgi:dihydrolipoamide dehydrogenase
VYDLIIIGGGPAGYAAAVRAAQLGGRVLLVEEAKAGGLCLHRGCVPAKVLQEFARTLTAAREVWEGKFCAPPDIVAMRQKKVISELYQGLLHMLHSRRIEMLQGTATLTDTGKVSVTRVTGLEEFTARSVLIATGSKEIMPAFHGVHSVAESLTPPSEPCRIVIIGGGNTGIELASAYAALGFTVSVVEKDCYLLPALADDEMRKWLGFLFKRRGISIHTATRVKGIRERNREFFLQLESGRTEKELVTDMIIAAMGRVPNLDVVAENLLIKISINEHGGIKVNEFMETSLSGVYAAGDVTGPPMLAHVAYAEGIVAADNVMGSLHAMQRKPVPHILNAEPQAAWTGLTESQAKKAGLRCRTGSFSFTANGCARIHGKAEGFVRIVALEEDDTVVGMQILGGHAAEMIMEGVLAVQNRLKATDIAHAIHPHPTFSEAIWEAALAMGDGALHE